MQAYNKTRGLAKHGYVLLLLFALCPLSLATGLTAQQIMQQVDTIEDGDSAKGELSMILIDKKGQKKKRLFSWQRRDDQQDAKTRMIFSSPADLKGTGFIGWNWHDGESADDTWLCLPALRRCKRIASEGQSGAFLGSDFSFYDINGLNISDWQYTLINHNEALGDLQTWLIEAVPAAGKETKIRRKTGYNKFRLWVRKDNFIIAKGHYFLTKGNKEKYFFSKGVEKIDGIWTIKQQQMITTVRGKQVHATAILLNDIQYNTPLAEAEFTTQQAKLEW